MPVQWSYSSWKTFNTCPLLYKDKYILKNKEPPGEAAMFGTAVHKTIEDHIRDGTPPPPEHNKYVQQIAPILKWPGQVYPEYKMALGFDLKPCDFFDPNYFVRGVADYVNVPGSKANVLDWKTGKSAKYADTKQLDLMALMIFKHFPKVDLVNGGLVFLVPDKVIKATFKKQDEKPMWHRWLYEISRMENATERDTFGPNPNGLCKKNCHVLTCPHNGRNLA